MDFYSIIDDGYGEYQPESNVFELNATAVYNIGQALSDEGNSNNYRVLAGKLGHSGRDLQTIEKVEDGDPVGLRLLKQWSNKGGGSLQCLRHCLEEMGRLDILEILTQAMKGEFLLAACVRKQGQVPAEISVRTCPRVSLLTALQAELTVRGINPDSLVLSPKCGHSSKTWQHLPSSVFRGNLLHLEIQEADGSDLDIPAFKAPPVPVNQYQPLQIDITPESEVDEDIFCQGPFSSVSSMISVEQSTSTVLQNPTSMPEMSYQNVTAWREGIGIAGGNEGVYQNDAPPVPPRPRRSKSLSSFPQGHTRQSQYGAPEYYTESLNFPQMPPVSDGYSYVYPHGAMPQFSPSSGGAIINLPVEVPAGATIPQGPLQFAQNGILRNHYPSLPRVRTYGQRDSAPYSGSRPLPYHQHFMDESGVLNLSTQRAAPGKRN